MTGGFGAGLERGYIFRGLDLVTNADMATWMERIPAFRRERVERYHFRMDRVRSLVAFLLLTFGLGRMPSAFKTGLHGKPELEAGTPQFNISHAGNCVVAAVSETPVGVDAEEIRSAPFDIMDRVFTPYEIQQIESAIDPDRAFFVFWTLKESYVKALGTGISFPLHDVEFTVDAGGARCSDQEFIFVTAPYRDCQVAVCGRRRIAIMEVGYEELLRKPMKST